MGIVIIHKDTIIIQVLPHMTKLGEWLLIHKEHNGMRYLLCHYLKFTLTKL